MRQQKLFWATVVRRSLAAPGILMILSLRVRPLSTTPGALFRTTISLLAAWVLALALLACGGSAATLNPATTPTPTPPPPLQPANPRIWHLIQPIDAAVRQYLASSNPRSPEALDALARELAEKYRENLELIREEIARTREMPELTDEEKERLDFIVVREHIHKVLQEMRMQELRRDSRVTIVVQTPFVVTPPASPTSPTGTIFPTTRVSTETPTGTPAPSLPTPTRPAYPSPPATATLLPPVDTADCSTVERISPDSAAAQEIRGDLMPAILDRVAPDIRTYNPDFEEIRSIGRVGEWVLLQGRFTKALEPAIFLLRATPSGYHLVTLWSGQAESATEIRDDLASQAPDVPRELIACLEPAEWFVTTTVQPIATVTRTAIPSETPSPTIVPTLPDPSTLHWQVVHEDGGTLRRLAGLTTDVTEAEFSPDGRWLAARLVREYLELGPPLTALYVLDAADGWHWIAAGEGDSQLHQHAWLPDGQLLWVKEGTLVFGTFDDRVLLDAPERIYEVWPGANHLALASGETALWRVDLRRDRWERMSELDRLVPKGGSPVSRSSSNLSVAPDGTFAAAILVHGELWRVPLAFGEPAVHLTTIEYPGRGGRITPPVPLAGSLYWISGEWVFQPGEDPLFKTMLLDSRDGTLVPVEDVLAEAGVAMAPAGLPTASPLVRCEPGETVQRAGLPLHRPFDGSGGRPRRHRDGGVGLAG